MGLRISNFFWLRDSEGENIIPRKVEDRLLLASCCAEEGYAREMVSYLSSINGKRNASSFLIEKILSTYKKYGFCQELKRLGKTKKVDEEIKEHVFSLLTPKKYIESTQDLIFRSFFNPYSYINLEISLPSGDEKNFLERNSFVERNSCPLDFF